MKIYFAYRTGYEPNLRFLNSFESDSILEWFLENWNTLCSEEYSDLLGTDVYGFPITENNEGSESATQSFFSKLFGKKKQETKPKNIQELLQILEAGIYVNEIEGNENYIKAATDDDEIELAWFIFTEEYKLKNEDKVAIWFNNTLPTSFGSKGLCIQQETFVLDQKGSGEGCTYFISSPIYDSGNFEGLDVVKIEGVRINNLLHFLKQNDIEEGDEILYSLGELKYIKYLAEQLDSNDLNAVFNAFSKFPLTELQDIDYKELTLAEIQEIEFNNAPEKSKVIVNEHSIEVSVNSLEIFYNYYILIDDLWIEKNETLAKSLLYFGSNWDIG